MDFLFATVKFSRSLHTYKRTYTRHKSFSGSWSHFQGPYTHANTHTNTLTQTHWHNNTVQVIFRVVVAVFGRLPVPVAKHSQVSFPLSLSVRPSFPCLSLPVSVPVCVPLPLPLPLPPERERGSVCAWASTAQVRTSIRKDCRHFLGAATQTRCKFLSLSLSLFSPHLHFVRRAEQDADITDLFQVLNITDAAKINALFHTGAWLMNDPSEHVRGSGDPVWGCSNFPCFVFW